MRFPRSNLSADCNDIPNLFAWVANRFHHRGANYPIAVKDDEQFRRTAEQQGMQPFGIKMGVYP